MNFTADQYYQSSLERIRQARVLYQNADSFALAIYCGGLAVESLLRAFRWIEDESFEGRHNLIELLNASRLMRIDDEYMRKKGASEVAIAQSQKDLRAAANEVFVIWHNNLRYASEARLKAYLVSLGRVQRTKGDPLKKNANDLLEAAQKLINRGVVLWTLRKKS